MSRPPVHSPWHRFSPGLLRGSVISSRGRAGAGRGPSLAIAANTLRSGQSGDGPVGAGV